VKIGGEEFSVSANLLGHPRPKITVLLNDKPINEATINEVDGDQHISIKKLTRDHTGRVN
jgi:hypothetical protein